MSYTFECNNREKIQTIYVVKRDFWSKKKLYIFIVKRADLKCGEAHHKFLRRTRTNECNFYINNTIKILQNNWKINLKNFYITHNLLNHPTTKLQSTFYVYYYFFVVAI